MSNAFEIIQDGGSASSDAYLVGRSHNNPTFSNLGYTGTLTGGTGIVNIGSGQIYKDALGNVGIGTSTPAYKLAVSAGTNQLFYVADYGTNYAGGGLSGSTKSEFSADTATRSVRLVGDELYGQTGVWGSHDISFLTNISGADYATKMIITAAGNVCIGATAPAYSYHKLYTYASSGNTWSGIRCDSLANSDGVGYEAMYGNYTRFVQLQVVKHSGITNPAGTLGLSSEGGTFYYLWPDNSGVFRISSTQTNVGTTGGTVVGAQTSDERLKNITGPVPYGLDEVLALEPIAYAMKSEPDVPKIGFSAQQVLPIIPESVFDTHEELEPGEPTKLGMEYVSLIPVLVNAIKALNEELQTLKARIN